MLSPYGIPREGDEYILDADRHPRNGERVTIVDSHTRFALPTQCEIRFSDGAKQLVCWDAHLSVITAGGQLR